MTIFFWCGIRASQAPMTPYKSIAGTSASRQEIASKLIAWQQQEIKRELLPVVENSGQLNGSTQKQQKVIQREQLGKRSEHSQSDAFTDYKAIGANPDVTAEQVISKLLSWKKQENQRLEIQEKLREFKIFVGISIFVLFSMAALLFQQTHLTS